MNDLSISVVDIGNIIIEYYDAHIAYHGKWIEEYCGDNISVINDEKIQFHNGDGFYESAKMNTPIYMNQDVIYCWKIKFDTIKDDIGMYDIFGVVSDECDNIGECAWGGLIDFYGISACSRLVWRGQPNIIPDGDPMHKTTIAINDVITMELDCKLSQLSFKNGEKEIYGPLQLPERKAWYPAVHFAFGEDKTSATFIN